MLTMTVHSGGDRASLQAAFERDRVAAGCDEAVLCADGDGRLLAAVETVSLFGGPRRVWCDLDGVTDDELAQVAAVAKRSDAVIVAKITELDAKTKKLLEGFAKLVNHPKSAAKDAPSRIEEIARTEGVRLDAATRRLLVERCGHDLDRARSVLVACRLGRIVTPTERHISILSGSSAAESAPWDVLDALERGELDTAITEAERCEPVAVTSFLASKFLDAARLAERGVTDPKAAAELLGGTPWQAEKSVRLAKRMGAERLHRCVIVCGHADLAAKRSGVEHALASALVELHDAISG
jgi:DNA polymerase III delta subunit